MSENSGRDFLGRWSRRKLANAEPASTAEPLPAEALPPAAADEPGTPIVAVETEITEEELAALPPVEELHAASDIVAFLRKGVPQALRNAALRRIWAVDPSIRDFIGEARDYSWDWNVPGGVPVSGPISPTTDVAGMLRRIIGEETPADDAPSQVAIRAEPAATVEPPEPASARIRKPEPQSAPEPDQEDPGEGAEEQIETLRTRRHGSALPA